MDVVYLIQRMGGINNSVLETTGNGSETGCLSGSVPQDQCELLQSVGSILPPDADLSNSVLLPILPQSGQDGLANINIAQDCESGEDLYKKDSSLKQHSCSICLKQFKQHKNLVLHLRTHTGEKPYKCADCGKGFSDPSSLGRHKRCHSGEKPYKCAECGKAFSQSSHLRSHTNSIHSNTKPFKCEQCSSTFSNVYLLKRHMLVHSGEKPYTCKHCSKSFRSSSSLVIHMRGHTGERPYSCSICDKRFMDSTSLKNHTRSHTGEKPFECKICKAKLANCWSLKNHMSARHKCSVTQGNLPKDIPGTSSSSHPELVTNKAKLPYQCSNCVKRFSNVSNLRRHIRVHSGEKPYVCEICRKAFSQSTHLKSHFGVHTRDKSNPCPECDKSFADVYGLRKHMRIHSGVKPFVCSFCGEAFTCDSSLRIHERKHTGEKPYQCTYCLQKFFYSNVLKRHVRSHTGEKPFPCTKCHMAFIDSWARRKHMRKHGPERSLTCSYCNKKQKSDGLLKKHLKDHHNVETSCETFHTCLLCQKQFDMEWCLKVHLTDCHVNEMSTGFSPVQNIRVTAEKETSESITNLTHALDGPCESHSEEILQDSPINIEINVQPQNKTMDILGPEQPSMPREHCQSNERQLTVENAINNTPQDSFINSTDLMVESYPVTSKGNRLIEESPANSEYEVIQQPLLLQPSDVSWMNTVDFPQNQSHSSVADYTCNNEQKREGF